MNPSVDLNKEFTLGQTVFKTQLPKSQQKE